MTVQQSIGWWTVGPIRTAAALSREHWAGQERAGYSYGTPDAGGGDDFYLDFTGRIPLVMTALDRLRQHGPMWPVWFRVAQHRGREPEPLLKALTDTRTAAVPPAPQAARARRRSRETAP